MSITTEGPIFLLERRDPDTFTIVMSGIKESLVELKAEMKNEEMKEEDEPPKEDWSEENPSP